MTTLNIPLPEPLKEFVETQAAKRGCASSADYIQDLIRQDQQRTVERELEEQLQAGLASGPAVPWTAESFAQKRQRLIDEHRTGGK